MRGFQVPPLLAATQFSHSGAQLVDLIRQMQDNGIQLSDAPDEKPEAVLSGDVGGRVQHPLDGGIRPVDSNFDQGHDLLGDWAKARRAQFHRVHDLTLDLYGARDTARLG